MGRGRSGRVSSNGASSGVSATHPQVSDIDAYGVLNQGRKSIQHSSGGDGPSDESVQWFMDNMGLNHDDAYRAADVFLFYSRGGDSFMHNDLDEGNGKINNGIIDNVLDNPMSPIFANDHHRGLFFYDSNFGGNARNAINDILSGGVWRENGATSFSSSLETAHSFGKWSASDYLNGVAITIHHPGGSGMPMKHLSSFSSENEVVHSRKQMKKGMKIKRYKWSENHKQVDIWVSD